MRVTVRVVGEDEARVAEVSDATTYGDLVGEVGLSPQAATVLVDGRPVPDDAPVEVGDVEVLRLIQGG